MLKTDSHANLFHRENILVGSRAKDFEDDFLRFVFLLSTPSRSPSIVVAVKRDRFPTVNANIQIIFTEAFYQSIHRKKSFLDSSFMLLCNFHCASYPGTVLHSFCFASLINIVRFKPFTFSASSLLYKSLK